MKRIDPSILIILIILLAFNFMEGQFSNPKEWLLNILIMLPGIIIGISFHEFAHGLASYKLGDPTPKLQGRLTLNPIAHFDPVGLIAILFCGFGWGRPVEINPAYYKHRRRDELIVSLAGVVMNLAIAIIFTVILRLLLTAGISGTNAGDVLTDMVFDVILINLVLMIFNLLPVPPLDGFGIVTEIFNLRRYDWYYQIYDKGFMILLILIVLGVTDKVLNPAVSGIWQLLYSIII